MAVCVLGVHIALFHGKFQCFVKREWFKRVVIKVKSAKWGFLHFWSILQWQQLCPWLHLVVIQLIHTAEVISSKTNCLQWNHQLLFKENLKKGHILIQQLFVWETVMHIIIPAVWAVNLCATGGNKQTTQCHFQWMEQLVGKKENYKSKVN